jgi:hypothetical protein
LNSLNVWNHLGGQVDQSLAIGTYIDTEGGAWRRFGANNQDFVVSFAAQNSPNEFST